MFLQHADVHLQLAQTSTAIPNAHRLAKGGEGVETSDELDRSWNSGELGREVGQIGGHHDVNAKGFGENENA